LSVLAKQHQGNRKTATNLVREHETIARISDDSRLFSACARAQGSPHAILRSP
jgi:hypothetical protein